MGNWSSRISEPCPILDGTLVTNRTAVISRDVAQEYLESEPQLAVKSRSVGSIWNIKGQCASSRANPIEDDDKVDYPDNSDDDLLSKTISEGAQLGNKSTKLNEEESHDDKFKKNEIDQVATAASSDFGEGNIASDASFYYDGVSNPPVEINDNDAKDATASNYENSEPNEEGEIDHTGGEGVDNGCCPELDSDNDSVATTCSLESSQNREGRRIPAAPLKHFSPRKVKESGKVLGDGGFGRVLQGKLHRGSPVAIKLFHAPIAITRKLSQVLILKHKNILPVFGVVYQPGEIRCPQLVLQYCSEGNVLQFLRRAENCEDINTFGKIAIDVVEGCQYLHEQGIVHGNLAARNILVCKMATKEKVYFNAKISDAGFIRFVEPFGGNYMKIPGSTRVVPIRWVPPEIIAEQEDGSVGDDYTAASDVWSYGVILWEIWTRGAIPYGAASSNLKVLQLLKEGYSPLKLHLPEECPSKVVSVMETIFQVDPSNRPSFSELRDPLQKYKWYGKEHKSLRLTGSSSLNASMEASSHPTYVDGFRQLNFQSRINASNNGGTASGLNDKKMNKKCKNLFEADEKGADYASNTLWQNTDQRRRGRGRGSRASQRTQRSGRGRSSINCNNGRDDCRSYYGGAEDTSIQMRSSLSPAHQAPPPYTEQPLPHHSTSRFSVPLPEYEYGSKPIFGSRGGRGRGYSGATRIRNHAMASENQSSSGAAALDNEALMMKVKKLTDEMEALRTEKTMQELLKKSAELAEIMKLVTTEKNEGSSNLSARHASGIGDDYHPDYDGGRWHAGPQNGIEYYTSRGRGPHQHLRDGHGQRRRACFKSRRGDHHPDNK